MKRLNYNLSHGEDKADGESRNMGPVAIILGIIGYRTLKRFNQNLGRKYAITF
jgi:hypothetical protein